MYESLWRVYLVLTEFFTMFLDVFSGNKQQTLRRNRFIRQILTKIIIFQLPRCLCCILDEFSSLFKNLILEMFATTVGHFQNFTCSKELFFFFFNPIMKKVTTCRKYEGFAKTIFFHYSGTVNQEGELAQRSHKRRNELHL